MFLLYLQRGVTIINRNLLGVETLAPEKLCTMLFGTDRLKITMKRQAACCVCQDYSFTQAIRAHAPHNLRPRTGDCIRPATEKQLCEHVVQSNILFNERNTITSIRKKSTFFVKHFVSKTFF